MKTILIALEIAGLHHIHLPIHRNDRIKPNKFLSVQVKVIVITWDLFSRLMPLVVRVKLVRMIIQVFLRSCARVRGRMPLVALVVGVTLIWMVVQTSFVSCSCVSAFVRHVSRSAYFIYAGFRFWLHIVGYWFRGFLRHWITWWQRKHRQKYRAEIFGSLKWATEIFCMCVSSISVMNVVNTNREDCVTSLSTARADCSTEWSALMKCI